MADQTAAQALATFVSQYSGVNIQSTSAQVVNFSGVLYNVAGSTPDPPIGGVTWKQLLINYGISGNCYVTSPLPTTSTSHPQFSVGGHMTTNAAGTVPTGGHCYLMPLCFWHNSTSKNGVPFQHVNNDTMLQLDGYMQADLAATFIARMPGAAPLRVVGLQDGQIMIQPADTQVLSAMKAGQIGAERQTPMPEHYVVLRQVEEAGRIQYVIDEVALP